MRRSLALFFGIVAAAIVVPLAVGSIYIQGLLVLACVYALLGLSATLAFGRLGYLTFGQAAFVGLGAYTAALLTAKLGFDYWLAVAIGMIPGAALGGLVGVASMRVGGAYFAITSLTVAEILRLVADNWISLTRGPMGLLVLRPTIPVLNRLGLSFNQYYLAIVILATGLVFLFIYRLLATPIGRAWEAIRESQSLAESLGIASLRYRVINIALSGAVGSLAGGLLVPKILVVSPDLFGVFYSALALMIAILGGRRALTGSLIGGAVFAFLPEFLRFADEARTALFSVLLLLCVRLKPEGLVAFLPQRRRRAAFAAADGASTPIEFVPQRAPATKPLLQVEGLCRRFRGLVAVDGVSFSVDEGEILGLMGPNGAGKTTCLSMISGFLRPTSGSIRFEGRDIRTLSPNRIAKLGLVRSFQQTTLFSKLTVIESIVIATHLAGCSGFWSSAIQPPRYKSSEMRRLRLASDALNLVGLAGRADDLADSLPYGEQRLLGVALALAARPRLLLLDESAAGLNPTEAEGLVGVLKRVRAIGVSIVLVEHNVPMLLEICDRLVVLDHGLKIAEGLPRIVSENAAVRAAYFGEGEKVTGAVG